MLVHVQQKVLRLEITMNNKMCVAVAYGWKNLLYYICSILLGEVSLVWNLVEKLSSGAELRDEEVPFLVLEKLKYL